MFHPENDGARTAFTAMTGFDPNSPFNAALQRSPFLIAGISKAASCRQ